MQILWFMTQQKLHSVHSTGTATGMQMSSDLPVFTCEGLACETSCAQGNYRSEGSLATDDHYQISCQLRNDHYQIGESTSTFGKGSLALRGRHVPVPIRQ